MNIDPLTIITGGLHILNNSIPDGYLKTNDAESQKPPQIAPLKKRGGSDGYWLDYNYSPMIVGPIQQTVTHTVAEIAEIIKDVISDEIRLPLEYKTRNRKNILLECILIEKRINVELENVTSQRVSVEMIYSEI